MKKEHFDKLVEATRSQAEEALFVPDEYYIRLLREFNSMSLRKTTRSVINAVREDLKVIERGMSAGDIIRNTKLAFKN